MWKHFHSITMRLTVTLLLVLGSKWVWSHETQSRWQLRLMGILFSDQVLDYLPGIMRISAGWNWQQLDASKGCQALGWNLTLDLSKDLKYTVQLPEHWCHPETRNEIIGRVGDAVYDSMATLILIMRIETSYHGLFHIWRWCLEW